MSVAELQARVVALEEERHKLQRINQALIGRIESSAAQSDEAYGAFQYSVVLAEQVRERTDALSQTMLELKASNQLLSDARLRAETAHQHLLDAIESISDAFVLFDPQQRIVLFNERFRALWIDSRARIGPGMRRAELHRLARSGGLIVEEQRGGDQQTLYRLRDERWLRMSERPTRDGGLAVLYSDVTEIKLSETARREQALAQKSHLLQRAVDNLSQGVAMVGADGVLELWNRRFLELCGLAPIAGHRAFAEVMAESELPLLTPRSQDSQGSPLSAREQRLFDGRVLEIRTHALPTGGFVNTFTDITERYRHAEALRASERWIRLITDQVPALIAYLSDELVYEFTNKVYEEWYRWPSGSMLGRCLRDVHGAEHCRRLEPYFERALAGESVTFEIAETALSGEERYMQRSYVPNRQADGRVAGLFVLIRDITERRRTAEALHQAYQNLEQRVRERTAELTTLNDQFKREIHERSQVEARLREAKREAEQANLSKTKFLAAVSHDLLQPLNAARLLVDTLRERGLPAAELQLVERTHLALEGAETLLTDLLEIARLDQSAIRPDLDDYSLDELLAPLASEFEEVARAAGLALRARIPRLAVRTDARLLSRILRNLLSNACRYTERGSVLLGARRRGGKVRLEVWDTGRGIPADQLQAIFLEFNQLDAGRASERRGVGLGLAIVDRIAGILGYRIEVHSTPGRGSLFAIEVPLVRKPARPAPGEAIARVSAGDPLPGRRLLVVDNETEILFSMSALLGQWGCEVLTATDLEGARKALDGRAPDAILVDYHLDHGATGCQLLGALREDYGAEIAAVMITADRSDDCRRALARLGVPLLNKPLKPGKLRAALSALLGEL